MATNPQIPETFKDIIEFLGVVSDAMADFGDHIVLKVTTKTSSGGLGVLLDYIENKTWDQIAGKLIGGVIDAWFVSKLGSRVPIKKDATVQQLSKGVVEGAVVWQYHPASDYFEKAFPAAKSFYTTLYNDVVNGDGAYARSVWEGIKGMADGDQFLRYYKNITFERFMSDMKDLFDPSFTVPTGVGVTFEGKKATVHAADGSDAQATITKDILANRQNINQVAIGTRVLDIRNLSEIELRNAVSHIDSVSFLLSEIKIRVGEKLDMGSFGIYTVGTNSYDYSLSLIAKNHGMTTKELVMLNTWLVDDGRIDFLYPTKVLVDAGTIVNSVINHTIAGSMQDDVLIDHNGGTDILIGNGGADYMEGGTGYDKYIANNGDTIMDSDQNGVVAFEGFKLSGGVSETGCKPNGDGEYRGNGGVYKLSSGKLTFTKDGTNETLTVQNFRNGDLGITLSSKDPGGSCPPPIPNPGPNTPKPDFPSPLVLDLNGDGVTSTFISSTSTYFDLDNDGVKQRTGWVQTTDALLALDKNTDGIINDAAELFGNHTTLKNGTKAANGFEALKEYDENKDGLIDAKDNIYNTLSLWQDSNSDGVTDTGELHTLKELGVSSINLGYTKTTDYEEQNRIFQTSSFTTTDGSTQSINDVWFMTNGQDTAREVVTLKDTIAALPDFRGAGNLSAMNEIKIERKVA